MLIEGRSGRMGSEGAAEIALVFAEPVQRPAVAVVQSELGAVGQRFGVEVPELGIALAVEPPSYGSRRLLRVISQRGSDCQIMIR